MTSHELEALATQHIEDAVRWISAIDREVPAPYRATVLESLLALARDSELPERSEGATRGTPRETRPPTESVTSLQDDLGIDLERYAHALAGPGRLRSKALITLDIVATQLGVDWMTPGEIERFLVDRARATHVYRTNVSNALRGARGLVDRRRRGRAYEYRLTEAGRVVVDREVAILGPGRPDGSSVR